MSNGDTVIEHVSTKLTSMQPHAMIPFVCECGYGMTGDRFTVRPDGTPVSDAAEREKALAKAREWDGHTFVIAGPDGPHCPSPGHAYHMAQKAGKGYVGSNELAQLETLLSDPAKRAALLELLSKAEGK